MDSFSKQPDEILDYDVDLTEWVTVGDTVNGTEVSVDGSAYAVNHVSAGISISITNAATSVPKLWVSGGVDGIVYKISVQVSTNSGRLKEVDFKMKIKDI